MSVREAVGHRLAIAAEIVGADLVEYNPVRHLDGMTATAAAKILKEILGCWWEGRDRATQGVLNHEPQRTQPAPRTRKIQIPLCSARPLAVFLRTKAAPQAFGHREYRFSGVQCPVMRLLKLAGLWALVAWAAGCGGGGMGSSGGGSGATNNSTSASIAISSTKMGPFSVAMSTSFQPAEWDDQFFRLNPSATTPLGQLGPHHIRLQGVSHGVPQTSASTWDFTILDDIAQPVLGVGDHSPEFQIAVAPAFMYDSNHNLDFAQFAAYSENLVRYYNVPAGFTAPDGQHASPGGIPITWWGIYNEPNFNNLDSSEYTQLYNTVVPRMQAVDPSLKFAAVELGDYSGLARQFLPGFVAGVTAPVDVLATHFYSTCNQQDTDAKLFATIPGFVSEVNDIYTQLHSSPALMNVPVWVTENNVNADFDKGGGISACNGTTFVTDLRGSSPFFAAWRPYVFSQLGQAGVEALYHWDFGADRQYGEVDYTTGALELGYWVDYWLGQAFPPTAGSRVLQFTSSENAGLETLPVINSDGSVVIMVANHAVNSPATDNDGPGVRCNVTLDVSALGNFTSANLLLIDKDTSVANGPAGMPMTPATKMVFDLNGYSVGILTLKP